MWQALLGYAHADVLGMRVMCSMSTWVWLATPFVLVTWCQLSVCSTPIQVGLQHLSGLDTACIHGDDPCKREAGCFEQQP